MTNDADSPLLQLLIKLAKSNELRLLPILKVLYKIALFVGANLPMRFTRTRISSDPKNHVFLLFCKYLDIPSGYGAICGYDHGQSTIAADQLYLYVHEDTYRRLKQTYSFSFEQDAGTQYMLAIERLKDPSATKGKQAQNFRSNLTRYKGLRLTCKKGKIEDFDFYKDRFPLNVKFQPLYPAYWNPEKCSRLVLLFSDDKEDVVGMISCILLGDDQLYLEPVRQSSRVAELRANLVTFACYYLMEMGFKKIIYGSYKKDLLFNLGFDAIAVAHHVEANYGNLLETARYHHIKAAKLTATERTELYLMDFIYHNYLKRLSSGKAHETRRH